MHSSFIAFLVAAITTTASAASACTGYLVGSNETYDNWYRCDPHISGDLSYYSTRYAGTLKFPNSSTNPGPFINFTLEIGPRSASDKPSLTRASYDDNPYYFFLTGQYNSGAVAHSIEAESSNDDLIHGQYWTVYNTRNAAGNGYDISGWLSTPYPTTWNERRDDSATYGFSSPLFLEEGWTMNGWVTEQAALMEIRETVLGTAGYYAVFEGVLEDGWSTLITTDKNITTSGYTSLANKVGGGGKMTVWAVALGVTTVLSGQLL